jgi:2-oxoglutarate dehydrogenase E1 component
MSNSEYPFNVSNLAFVESLYVEFLNDARSVPDAWRQWFESRSFDGAAAHNLQLDPSFVPARLFNGPANGKRMRDEPALVSKSSVSVAAVQQEWLAQLVRAYRERGHAIARVDPLGLPRPEPAELDPSYHGFKPTDLDRQFSATTIHGPDVLTLRQVLERLRNTYCRSIGVEYMHIADREIRDWLQERMESTENRIRLSREGQIRILSKLTDAVMFEEFLQTKYLGAKIFSLQGSESLIPLLTFVIDRAGDLGIDEIIMGMAHRGRLNVLANIMSKSPRDIFREFEDRDPELYVGSGDVKYHLGYTSDHYTAGGRRVHLSLCFNPSHLEFVNPVVLGRVRARQDRAGAARGKLPLLIHGDAALAGEGIVQETLNLAQLEAYTTCGTLHVVINNQIGFTTPPQQGRSGTYATAVARMLDIPVFHVNGEDPEAVAQVVSLAVDFRNQFARDVFIDMYGYRRHGHNEGDEPAFTQPLLYAAISRRKSVRDGYLEHLLQLGEVTREEADQVAVERRATLEDELKAARRSDFVHTYDSLDDVWSHYRGGPEAATLEPETALDATKLSTLLEAAAQVPQGFHPHKKVQRLLEQRLEMARAERALDWGAAETLAFASLVSHGTAVRLTGQDSERGTFSHRHAVLHDVDTGSRHVPLMHVSAEQAPFDIHNSSLSEASVLGFEYGYSVESPDALVIWEAQFGDFCNAAQVIIDQFIVSAEDKWKQLSGIVLLLPHGFEGMGPEHSSARIERWLLLAAEENIQICQPSTPAQFFHLLRRQALRSWRKPLIVFTPKSLLRHPKATSELAALARGRFQRVLPDTLFYKVDPRGVRRVLLCSGKVYYTLAQRREELKRQDVAIVRVEQFYPLPDEHLRAALDPFVEGTQVIWFQEEPENMGAWRHLRARFGARLFARHPLTCIARAESASPATGSASSHRLEEEESLDKAFSL